MQADTDKDHYRTVADTDPMLMQLLVGETPVPDSATVVMHLKLDPVLDIEGEAEGGGAGNFLFPTESLGDVTAKSIKYEVEVTEAGGSQPLRYTVAAGKIIQRPQIA